MIYDDVIPFVVHHIRVLYIRVASRMHAAREMMLYYIVESLLMVDDVWMCVLIAVSTMTIVVRHFSRIITINMHVRMSFTHVHQPFAALWRLCIIYM